MGEHQDGSDEGRTSGIRKIREQGLHLRRAVRRAALALWRRGKSLRARNDLRPAAGPRPLHSCAGDGIEVTKLARLLFGEPAHGEKWFSNTELAAFGGGIETIAPKGVITTRGQLRRLLGSTENLDFPSTVTVRFEADDVRVVYADGFKLVVDEVDAAIGRVIAETREWEPHTSQALRDILQPGMTFLDVGANIGWFSMLAASIVGPSGRVVAVEPWSENCRLLILSRAQNNFQHVELWPFALDRDRGWAHFTKYVGSNAGYIPSGLEAIASGSGSIVPTFALDQVLDPATRIDLVKIDVEGAEHRVLDGACRTLESWRPPVISEFSFEMSRRASGGEPNEFVRWFLERGWRLHVIDRTTRELVPFPQFKDFLAWWPHPYHVEELLFVPQ